MVAYLILSLLFNHQSNFKNPLNVDFTLLSKIEFPLDFLFPNHEIGHNFENFDFSAHIPQKLVSKSL